MESVGPRTLPPPLHKTTCKFPKHVSSDRPTRQPQTRFTSETRRHAPTRELGHNVVAHVTAAEDWGQPARLSADVNLCYSMKRSMW